MNSCLGKTLAVVLAATFLLVAVAVVSQVLPLRSSRAFGPSEAAWGVERWMAGITSDRAVPNLFPRMIINLFPWVIILSAALLTWLPFLLVPVVLLTRVFGGKRTQAREKADAEEGRMMQELHHGFSRLEEHIEALETILMGRIGRHPASGGNRSKP